MSEREKHTSLSALPQPKSPRALDDSILAMAREQAPQPQRRSNLAWVGGMASACVLVVAVLITGVPNPFTERHEHADAWTVARTGSVALPADAAREQSSEEPQLEARETLVAKGTPTAAPAPPSALREQRQATGFAAGMDAEESVLADALPPKRSDEAPDASTVLRSEHGAAMAFRYALPRAKGGTNKLTLRHCEQLLKEDSQNDDDGREAQDSRKAALWCYEQLRRQCPDCNLPETLEDALEQQKKMQDKEREPGPDMR